jgi:hypothetical protein
MKNILLLSKEVLFRIKNFLHLNNPHKYKKNILLKYNKFEIFIPLLLQLFLLVKIPE